MNPQHTRRFIYGGVDLDVLQALFDRPVEGELAILNNWALAIQTLQQIPDVPVTIGNVTLKPREIIWNTWQDPDFQSYGIVPCKGKLVPGYLVRDISEEERALIDDYELTPFGWFQEREVTVRTVGLTGCLTEGFGDGQEWTLCDERYSKDRLPPFLMPKEKVLEVAAKVRYEFLERQAL